jgi:hypothetical protein
VAAEEDPDQLARIELLARNPELGAAHNAGGAFVVAGLEVEGVRKCSHVPIMTSHDLKD